MPGVRLILVPVLETDWESVKIELKLTDNDKTDSDKTEIVFLQ